MAYEDNRTLEQVYNSAVSGLYARIRSYYDFIYDKYGAEEGLKLITEMSSRYGLVIAARGKDSLKDNSLDSVADFLLRILSTVGRRPGYEPVMERTATKAFFKVKRCPMNFDKKAMCLAHTNMEKTLVEELNPSLTYRVEKTVAAGDPYCVHVLEIVHPHPDLSPQGRGV